MTPQKIAEGMLPENPSGSEEALGVLVSILGFQVLFNLFSRQVAFQMAFDR